MLSHSPHKAKVNLKDYSYRRDIEIRLLMAKLSTIEVDILHEIIHHSLTISVEQLAEDVNLPVKEILPILDKLTEIKLFKREQMTLIVDKEIRKYLETKMEKFEEDFQPDLEFLQNILSKVPLDVLLLWYPIPSTSNNIFGSIIENYFLTPKIYQEYLNELKKDNSLFKSILEEVYKAPHFKATAKDLIDKFHFTQESFEEALLMLEYHFACCLSYQKIDNEWVEVVTPFVEWLQYLKFDYETQARIIQSPIEKIFHTEFHFIQDLTILLQASHNRAIFPLQYAKHLYAKEEDYQKVISKLIQLKFAKQNEDQSITATDKGRSWMLKSLPEQAISLAHDPLNMLPLSSKFPILANTRNFHLIEKSLRKLNPYEWVKLDEFIAGFIEPIGDKQPIKLKNKGKRWRYEFPSYNEQDKQFIQAVILERLGELGVVSTGLHEGSFCFCLTSFGNRFIH